MTGQVGRDFQILAAGMEDLEDAGLSINAKTGAKSIAVGQGVDGGGLLAPPNWTTHSFGQYDRSRMTRCVDGDELGFGDALAEGGELAGVVMRVMNPSYTRFLAPAKSVKGALPEGRPGAV
jgi:hypothetical protein